MENMLPLNTDRLILQPLNLQWKDDIFREFTSDITTYMNPDPPTEISETEQFIQMTMEKMNQGKEIVCAVLQKETNDFLGCVGIHRIDSSTPEFGIWLKKSAHGQGYGKEAIHMLKAWIDEHLTYDYILYPVDEANIPSRKIPESLGGVIHDRYTKDLPSGKQLSTVEYRIYPLK